MTRLAVFDCDGTLIDSQANIVAAMADAFVRNGLAAPDPHATRRVVGLSLVEAMRVMLPQGEAALHVALAEDYKAAFQRLRADSKLDAEPLYPGVREGLETLRADGWLLAVATGKSDRGLALALAHHGLGDFFVSLQTADRHPSKPHPAMLWQAIADGGVGRSDAVIIGDTVFDVGMGVNGGVRAIGVDWGYHEAAELMAAGAEAVARDMDHLLVLLHG
ncbi:HAD hydrolase-like protein [Sandaracinobacteroides saxicola]|uniref:HAD hydrolase-like protein n=1 Tax=Sandaracinobacteroides saxicola TaxID=2759707 RepID=A0A7G5IFM8_9SPHN|nr:HAD hydrolase-like protein [Sandaracinobacteroides saxicola]QMW22170.1 HAD hydrolase-like protein [Sandaracinobacteroides saxicola]